MARFFGIRARLLARVASPVLLCAVLGACSSMPDWVDPTTWLGGDSQPSADQSVNPGSDTDAAASGESSTGQTPDLADIPAKPAPPSTPEEQKQVADSLAADRADAHYSADALRGGTDAPAPPPPAAPAASNPAAGNSAAATADSAESDTETANGSGASAANDETASGTPASSSAPAAAAPVGGTEDSAATEASAPSANQIASTEPVAPVTPSPAQPAEPIAPQASSGMQATFEPSKAPALDPSVAQYVPAQVLSQYRATAAEAASPGLAAGEGPAPSKHHRHRHKS
jgi:hypothetical protein